MADTEKYLRSIDRSLRQVKAAVRGMLAFFTFIFLLMIVGGIYLYVQRNELAKSYYQELRRGFEEVGEKLGKEVSEMKKEKEGE